MRNDCSIGPNRAQGGVNGERDKYHVFTIEFNYLRSNYEVVFPCLNSRIFGNLAIKRYYRFQINCTFLPKSEIFYMADVKNLCSNVKNLPVD